MNSWLDRAWALGLVLLAAPALPADTFQVSAYAQAYNVQSSQAPNPLVVTDGPHTTGSATASASRSYSSGYGPNVGNGIPGYSSSATGLAITGVAGDFRAGSYLNAGGSQPTGFNPANGPPPIALDATGRTTWGGTFTNTTGTPQAYVLSYRVENVGLSISAGFLPGDLGPAGNGYSGYYLAEVSAVIKLNGATVYDFEAELQADANGLNPSFSTTGVPPGLAYPTFIQFSPTNYFAPLTLGQLELGIFGPGESFTLEYVAETYARSYGAQTPSGYNVVARFGDPLNFPNQGGGQLGLQQEAVGIPEPGTLLLLAAGGLGLAWARRRRI